MYYAFYENVFLQVFYMGTSISCRRSTLTKRTAVIIIAGIASAYVGLFPYATRTKLIFQQIVLSPHHRSHRWHRTLTFIALGLSAVVPITHILFTQGLAHAREKMSLDLIVAGGASYIFGALL